MAPGPHAPVLLPHHGPGDRGARQPGHGPGVPGAEPEDRPGGPEGRAHPGVPEPARERLRIPPRAGRAARLLRGDHPLLPPAARPGPRVGDPAVPVRGTGAPGDRGGRARGHPAPHPGRGAPGHGPPLPRLPPRGAPRGAASALAQPRGVRSHLPPGARGARPVALPPGVLPRRAVPRHGEHRGRRPPEGVAAALLRGEPAGAGLPDAGARGAQPLRAGRAALLLRNPEHGGPPLPHGHLLRARPGTGSSCTGTPTGSRPSARSCTTRRSSPPRAAPTWTSWPGEG